MTTATEETATEETATEEPATRETGSEPAGHRARHRYARIGARKARLVADVIRGRSANEALEILELAHQRAAAFYLRVLKSAMANAALDENVNVNRLYVSDARADEGPMLQNRKRWRPGPQGRAMPYVKRTSHLTVVVAEVPGDVDRKGREG